MNTTQRNFPAWVFLLLFKSKVFLPDFSFYSRNCSSFNFTILLLFPRFQLPFKEESGFLSIYMCLSGRHTSFVFLFVWDSSLKVRST